MSRNTREERLQKEILLHLQKMKEPKDAETIWLDLKNDGYLFSMSSFSNRLKRLVEAELVVKNEEGRKAVYCYANIGK